jgi:acyl carrier protein
VETASKQQIFDMISRIMVDRFDFDESEIVANARIVEDLDLDSIDTLDLAIQLEEETGVNLEEDVLKSIRSLEDIVDILHRGIGTGSV